MAEIKKVIFDCITKLDNWICVNDWKAYDPFDGLSAKLLSQLTFNNHYLKIVLQQSVRRFPFNLRPLLGIKKQTSSKGMAFCALGYLKLYEATKNEEYLNKMTFCLDWLKEHFTTGFSGYAWGNHFNYESRGGSIPLGIPTIVWTSLVSNIFLDAFETTGEQTYLETAKSSADFILKDIGRSENSDGTICFMYTPQNNNDPSSQGCIHNANVLGASLLAKVYKYTRDEQLFTLAKNAINYTVKHQLEDGGWYYGVEKKYWWVDSFHTGYVMDSIYDFIKATGDKSYEENLIRGFKYFISNFFMEDGTPKYYANKTYPIDIQCPSQAIQSLVRLQEYDPHSIEIAKNVAMWTIENMQDQEGYFYFRKYPIITNKTPMFHWGQATMLSALAHLYANL